MVSTSSPGFSLMAEGMSYMAGSQVPCVLVNVMRGGPGLGSIGPAQADYLQAVKGHGHGDYRTGAGPGVDRRGDRARRGSFEIAERYRTPVILLADGVLGQAMEPVVPDYRDPPRRDAVGAERRRRARPACRPLARPAARGTRAPQRRAPGEIP